jgi:hypothetical protein
MPIVVISGSDICPATTGECAEDAHANYELGQRLVLP